LVLAAGALATALGALPAAEAHAQRRPPRAGEPAEPASAATDANGGKDTDEVSDVPEDTPRSTLTRFFELSRSGHYVEASKYLELPDDTDPKRAAQLAERLKLVLDHYAWIDFSQISAAVSGASNDGLSSGVDEIARLPISSGLTAPVRLVRRGPSGARWQFSRVTVQRIDAWYEGMPHRWLLELAPEPLLRMGPYNLLWAQWCALPIFLILVWSGGVALNRGARRIMRPLAKRAKRNWEEPLLRNLSAPITFVFALLVAYLLVPLLGLYAPAQSFAHRAIRALFIATFFWALARSVDVAGQLFARSQWGRGAPTTRAMLLFGSRVGKAVVAALALLALFSELGYPVTSLLAGLGVGGIAVALSAQKSLENLIGAFAIAIDQPFREGDFVKVDNMMGTVELIGMRSTRFRTLDRTLVSIPNGKLADMRIETFAPRDRIRMFFTFGLTYDTTEKQLREVLTGFEKLLKDHPKLWPEGFSVRFAGLTDAGLQVEAGCWFNTDWDSFTLIRQDVLLGLMAIMEKAGARFAFPMRTIQMLPALEEPEDKAAGTPSESGLKPRATQG
jgi:MscS family membrane protein